MKKLQKFKNILNGQCQEDFTFYFAHETNV